MEIMLEAVMGVVDMDVDGEIDKMVDIVHWTRM